METIPFCSSTSLSRSNTSVALSQVHVHRSATIRFPVLGKVGPDRSGDEPGKFKALIAGFLHPAPGKPMHRGAHIYPVAIQLQPDFLIASRNQKRL